MLHEEENEQNYPDEMVFDKPFDIERWKPLVDRVIDHLNRDQSGTLKDIAEAIGYPVHSLELWLNSNTSFQVLTRTVGMKTTSEKIADALDNYFSALDTVSSNNARIRCPVRVKTTPIRAMIAGMETARALGELVEICAPPGLGKTEAAREYLSTCRKAEGFYCPVWLIALDESCISLKAVFQLICRQILSHGHYDPKSEFSMFNAIMEETKGRGGVLLVDEFQHLADAQKIMGVPILNALRSLVDRGVFGIACLGNGEMYRRLTSGTGRDKGAYTQLLSRMQDFRVEILGLGQGDGTLPALTREDVFEVAAAWGVTGTEEKAWCLKAAAQRGALRIMTNIFRLSLDRHGRIDISTLNQIRRV
jgi:DNA transposition AAA+ family ATPase